ncbi:ABC transporter ATP-binding protein [Chelatococcus asaccharovorans]|uniref:Peptide/nickel transport system ATP-binding protein n=1 Tax=Chelatococcus asaccharovorans TaxID=28210 RepID=A0A2V3TVT9_9HYPH|nr:ATP-binding cassette domain-containing protein [Chelatococcus asaccharovorans]MBS7705097.1 ABC transporter ATP-binding protein [Chelatococcus asaccharovorans]PXW53588.1 peptide/nickel transport system ATP-binding protein [Chelatococcus asaccharovorans]
MNAPLGARGLVVSGLSVAAGTTTIVDDVSFTLSQGRPMTLLGASGSGKSLVAHAIMGSLPPGLTASGAIHLDGADLFAADDRPDTRWGRTIALLPQEPWLALDPTMRIGAQVMEVHRHLHGARPAEARRRGLSDLAEVGLADRADAYPFALSGGMCQRAAIAIAHAAGAGLLIADEPTKGLDAVLRDGVVARLRREVEQGRLLLTITHDIAVAKALGGMIGVMLDGRLVEFGPAAEVLERPRHDYARALIAADPSHWRAPSLPAPTDVVVQGHKLAKSFGGRELFSGLDISVRRGEVIAITGPSGCGKTTIGNLLLGLAAPDAGGVERSRGVAPQRFQKLYQDPPAAFAPHQTLRRGLEHLLKLHRLPWRQAEEAMERLALAPVLLDRRPGEVSGGELQRFAILRALLLDPVFLFADEATSRLDPVSQQDVVAILIDAVRNRGLALLIVTHEIALAERVASRVIRIGSDLPLAGGGDA